MDKRVETIPMHWVLIQKSSPIFGIHGWAIAIHVWSPQGNQIAVKLTYDDVDKTGLYVMNVDTKKLELIKKGYIRPEQWLADGSFVYFVANLNYVLGWIDVEE
jgi:hypothetical protein